MLSPQDIHAITLAGQRLGLDLLGMEFVDRKHKVAQFYSSEDAEGAGDPELEPDSRFAAARIAARNNNLATNLSAN